MSIPRTGSAGGTVNCYTVELLENGEPYLLIEEVNGQGFRGKKWDGQKYEENHLETFEDVRGKTVSITHYYGFYEIRSDGLWDFIFDRITRWSYLRIWLNKMGQSIFNQTQTLTFKRTKVLRHIVDTKISADQEAFSSWGLMSGLYSERWFNHPKGEGAHKWLKLFLDSLVNTGELSKDGIQYKIQGKAIAFLIQQEQEEQRHRDSQALQRRMVYLTFSIVIVTAFTVDKGSILFGHFANFYSYIKGLVVG